jgi:ABC-type multidrug transport system fused ATPase/permease subunit
MFTSLTLLILLNSPLSQLFQSIPDLFAAVNCIRRIQDYLNADSRNDYRSAKLSSPSSATPHDSSDESHILAHSVTDDIELRHMTIAAGKRTTSNTEGAEAISVRQGAFGWGRDAEPIVRDIDLSISETVNFDHGDRTYCFREIDSGQSSSRRSVYTTRFGSTCDIGYSILRSTRMANQCFFAKEHLRVRKL